MDAIELLASHNDFMIATGEIKTTMTITANSARATGRRLVLNGTLLPI
jgi:hypothetical protein